MKIVVIGDICIDRYWITSTSRQSAESPIPVCEVQAKFDLPGGAGNVRSNLRSLGIEGLVLMKALKDPQNFPVKNRLMVGDHQIARWDENDYTSPFKVTDLAPLGVADGVIVADYGKGAVTEEVIQYLRNLPIPVFVDTKQDPRSWIGAENVVMFPNLVEYTKYLQAYEWFPQVLRKEGKDGLSWVSYGQTIKSFPSLANHVRSVNGAGDSVVAAFVVALLSGGTLEYSLKFASAAAAIAVESPYTTSVLGDLVEAKLMEVVNV